MLYYKNAVLSEISNIFNYWESFRFYLLNTVARKSGNLENPEGNFTFNCSLFLALKRFLTVHKYKPLRKFNLKNIE